MISPAVRAMAAAAGASPRHTNTKPHQLPLVTPPKISFNDHRDDITTELPLPANTSTKQYTRSEAVEILSKTEKRSHVRGKIMREMIEQGYVPTTERTLQRLMQAAELGKAVDNEPWTINVCKGIQSSALDEHAPDHPQYCYGRGWYMDSCMQWHAKGCSNDDLKNGRCKKCLSTYKNMNKGRHPDLFEPTPSVMALPIVPDQDGIAKMVDTQLKKIQQSDIDTDPVLQQAAKLLKAFDCDRVALISSKMFMVCQECTMHRVCGKRANNGSLCKKCKNKSTVKAWQQKRREDNHDQRVSPQSSTAMCHLTKPELKERAEALKSDRRSQASLVKRLKAKVAAYEVQSEMDEELLNHMNEALEHATNHPETLHKDIESTLLEVLKEEAKSNGCGTEDELLSHEDTKQFVDFITESMKNHIHKVNGNENRYRFSPYLTGLAMNQLVSSGTSRYDQWRDESLIVMPSSGNLAQKKHAQKIRVGDCIVMYEKQLLLRQWLEEMGQLMCDEMHLQEDILFNVMSNKMVGFTEDFICKKKIMKSLLDEDKIESFEEPAKKVNQWRYRSVNGRSYNCEFWFNGDSLDGDTLLEQFVQVVVHCEIIGSRVLGFVSDAGGSNARLFKLLRGMRDVPECSWLPLDYVRTSNPYDPSRYIYLFHCSTHDLKALRNALFTSWRKDGKKEFLDANDNKIGKAILEECFQRDRMREMRNAAPLSDVRESAIIINRHSKMNVKIAKSVFTWKTLAEILSNLYSELGVPMKDQLSNQSHPFGYMPAAARHLRSILKKKSPQNAEYLASKISSFEWMANVHEIFNATLMNTDILIHWDNIDRYEAEMQKCLLYFEGLRRKQLERRTAKDKKWELSFLSSKTWLNLRITIRGFFAYCRALIDYADKAPSGSIPRFCAISPAHSNSSAIEAWFSCTRNSRQDSGTSYSAWVGSRDMFNAGKALKNNKMYSAQDVGEMSGGCTRAIGPNELVKFHANREQQTKDIIHQFDISKTYQVDSPTPAFASVNNTMMPSSLGTVELTALEKLSKKTLPKGYLAALLEQVFFQQKMRLSIGTATEVWFKRLLEHTLEVEGVSQFDDVCQKMMDKMFEMTVEALQNRKKDRYSFEYDLHNFHRSEEFTELCSSIMPNQISEHHPGCVILFLAVSRLLSDWLRVALEDARRERNPELFRRKNNTQLSAAEENSEVNRFLGWSVFSAKKKYKSDAPSDTACRELLGAMIVRERQLDNEYMDKYYDPALSLLNRGGLTLINSKFFEWGKLVLRKIRDECNEEAINRDPQNSFARAKQMIMSDEKLKSEYILLCRRHSPNNAKRAEEVYDVFLRKAIHSRFAAVFRRWKEANIDKKGKTAFRVKLKVQSSKPIATESKQVPKPKSIGSNKRKAKKLEAVPFSMDAAKNRAKRRKFLDDRRKLLDKKRAEKRTRRA